MTKKVHAKPNVESGFARAGTRIGELLKGLSNGTVALPLFAEIYL